MIGACKAKLNFFTGFYIINSYQLKLHTSVALVAALTLSALMDSSFWFDTINLGWSIVYIKGLHVIISI